ncbi:VCBS repeat-containing protein [Tropicimonas sp. IMCC6043]|uniref:FG-GAP repeat domain-containing protein n=1 Tax=Tropicimonas sp. IMCC6043 TaxID=2510645 RepID=UPI00101DA511|nr:VCBS repeat-containing protein [Tropicimonas sp. IMCC6043]RYH07725.1 VCBS repeat-containing protein [Tropicimonas sp. IMCC6043]
MRGAALALTLALAFAAPALACNGPITRADYAQPTGRYPHGVLGDAEEWGALRLTCGGKRVTLVLPEDLVFEDIAPRLADLDRDGQPEVIVVESHRDRGARLAVWGRGPEGVGRRAATPFIGTRFRWLAPLGAADLDGDGTLEVAYVDRPHLARILRVWRYEDGGMTEIAAAPGFTNHRIGETDIAGGIRTCAGAPEMILTDPDWTAILAVRLQDGRLVAREIGPHRGRASFRSAMACRTP